VATECNYVLSSSTCAYERYERVHTLSKQRGTCTIAAMRSLILLWPLVVATAGKNFSHDEECQSAVEEWMWNDAHTQFDTALGHLSVSLAGFYQALAEAGCEASADVRLELWRASSGEDRGFTWESWKRPDIYSYQRCKGLREYGFRLHAAAAISQAEDMVDALFRHALEQHYLLRLCHCGHKQEATACICDYAASGAFCSRRVDLPQNLPGQHGVLPWCRDIQGIDSRGGYKQPPTINLSFNKVTCEGRVTVRGVVASCSPIVDNSDSINLTLFDMPHGENICQDKHLLQNTIALKDEAKLLAVNDTHGSFELITATLTQGRNYCLILDLNHPYCHPHDHGPVPSVCHAMVQAPLVVAEVKSCSAGDPTFSSQSSTVLTTMAILGSLFIALVFIFCLCFFKKYCQAKREKRDLATMAKPVINGMMSTDEECAPLAMPTPPEILLLHFPEKSTSFLDEVANLSQWLRDQGCRVRDIAAEEEQEEVAAHQEEWVQNVMKDHQTCALVVNSPAASAVSEAGECSEDALAPVRANALKFLTSHFIGDYRRLIVVSFTQLPPPDGGPLLAATPHRQFILPQHYEDLAQELLGRRIKASLLQAAADV